MGCWVCLIFPGALKQNTSYAEYRGGSALPLPEPEDRGRCSVLTRGCLQHCKDADTSENHEQPGQAAYHSSPLPGYQAEEAQLLTCRDPCPQDGTWP